MKDYYVNYEVEFKSVSEENKGKKVYKFIATKEVIDRDGDVVIVDGINLKDYKRNPVVLFSHSLKDVVGKAVNVYKDNNQVIIEVEFADTDLAREVESLVEGGFLKTVSIGFRAKEVYYVNSDYTPYNAKTVQDLKDDYPDIYNKYKNKFNLIYRIITKSDLYEVSIVSIPANPEAEIILSQKGFIIKNAVRFSHPANTLLDSESEWDGREAEMSLRKWASSDGSGEKDKIDWNKYRKGFTWYDANAVDNFTSYKYPHHWVKNGKFYTVRRGVISAMAYFLANKEYIPADDRKGVYNHLKRHYEEFEMEAPEYKEFTQEDIKSMFDKETVKLYEEIINNNLKEDNQKEDNMAIEELKALLTELVEEVKSLKEEVEEIKTLKNEVEESKSFDKEEAKEVSNKDNGEEVNEKKDVTSKDAKQSETSDDVKSEEKKSVSPSEEKSEAEIKETDEVFVKIVDESGVVVMLSKEEVNQIINKIISDIIV